MGARKHRIKISLRDRYTYELTEVGAESWLRKFEHGDKWSFCLKAKELKFLGWKGPKTGKHLVDQAAEQFRKRGRVDQSS